MFGVFGVLAAAVLWGTVGPAQVLAGSAADPGALGVLRLLVGGAALGVVTLRHFPWRQLAQRDTLRWLVLAAAATGVYQATFLYAVAETGAALGTAVALGCAPVATGICARWWLRERLTRAWVAGTVGAVAGCVLILSPAGSGEVSATGIAYAVVSGTCYGVYTVAAKGFLDADVPAVGAVALTLLLGGVLLSPLLLLSPRHLLEPDSVALIGWIGLAGTAVAYVCFVRGLHHVTASNAGTLSLAEPLTAAALGVLVLGERLNGNALVGSALLLIGLLVVSVTPGRALRRATADARTRRSSARPRPRGAR
ncbi:MAG: EamA family transporter [Pseudonocardia sp.]|nr:EamA family transporter [Pseudonocardia sp.]